MTIDEFRKLPEDKQREIQIEMLRHVAEASTALEYGNEEDL